MKKKKQTGGSNGQTFANHLDYCDTKPEITLADGLNPAKTEKRSSWRVLKSPLRSKCPAHCGSVEAKRAHLQEPRNTKSARRARRSDRASRETLQRFGATNAHVARSCRHKRHFAYFTFMELRSGWLTCECARCCGSMVRIAPCCIRHLKAFRGKCTAVIANNYYEGEQSGSDDVGE